LAETQLVFNQSKRLDAKGVSDTASYSDFFQTEYNTASIDFSVLIHYFYIKINLFYNSKRKTTLRIIDEHLAEK
jgi:hypothetical protein